jgi:Flp pilus assembly protein TadG
MVKWYRAIQRDERGATIVWVGLMAISLMAMLALALDGGYAYAQRRRMQVAADAAAVGGARVLAFGGNTTQIESAIEQLVSANAADSFGWSLLNGNRTVEVTASLSFPTFFAGVLGRDQMTASATAQATLGYVSRVGGLFPMITEVQDFEPDREYTLFADDLEAPGNFGWLDWDGPPVGNDELVENMRNPGRSGEWQIGTWVPGGPGVDSSIGVRDALEAWLNDHAGEDLHVTIPFYEEVRDTGSNTEYRIIGFGEFALTEYRLTGANKYVKGQFKKWAKIGLGGGPDRGLISVTLTK